MNRTFACPRCGEDVPDSYIGCSRCYYSFLSGLPVIDKLEESKSIFSSLIMSQMFNCTSIWEKNYPYTCVSCGDDYTGKIIARSPNLCPTCQAKVDSCYE